MLDSMFEFIWVFLVVFVIIVISIVEFIVLDIWWSVLLIVVVWDISFLFNVLIFYVVNGIKIIEILIIWI